MKCSFNVAGTAAYTYKTCGNMVKEHSRTKQSQDRTYILLNAFFKKLGINKVQTI
jgi:hypothetical protein